MPRSKRPAGQELVLYTDWGKHKSTSMGGQRGEVQRRGCSGHLGAWARLATELAA